ncbi:putative ferric-chelate reductase (NADH) [Helianthus annuus]|uniref:Ferric-chelate reductase (NADH) n=1 Tax=Helianthus annuus TaxID=4232 RepID=A0A251SGJ5_HELAN|nr:ferric reduction oxidase 7, chloroplastic isoform X1 [Helianthus annuus]KAF5809949.1 putative ferric-chelate reductase (NADH) [Helianthus annuus]KAJ0580882.1 putative ferric-chelate reductase (NADH) [Helianthus annuus]KAJ0588604.1 putative ferric-chelate reductase (NADH) [Helianthus annuus]KAJ0757501.1 putative ferric-chelate reductase (NADH) [Helianthus annuus]KAJ0761189.1 putative ferric-chelate reductase (NADH) [Helianthus annuus]
MGTESSQEPLLLSSKDDQSTFTYINQTSFLLKSTKWVLKFAMWVIFICWASFIFLVPSDSVQHLYKKVVNATSGSLFGTTGSIFLIYSGPVMIIGFLAIIYLWVSGKEEIQEKKKKSASFRLWTFPVIIDGPFGVVTAAELIGIMLFAVYIIWAVTVYTIKNISLLPLMEITDTGRRNLLLLELTGLRFGFIGLICMAFLFLPVARGSFLLRLIDIPFEHATRYHVWLGHLTMMLFTLHGLFYVIAWAIQGRLIEELTAWKKIGIANLPGVISLVAGLFMWVTSLPPVRRLNFELFFYTHQLYVVFVVFLAMHVGDFIFSIAAAGIFLFMLDRFLRFFQSRKTVDIISAKCLPSGTVELIISKPEGLQYNALGWVFIQIRELSWLQWHPFSVSSSPLDGKHHLAVLIKVLGDWTEKLRGRISSVPEEKDESQGLLQPNLSLKASIEGPYGHESPYHLTYENLILVAGGIGISPFLAILSDILHRLRESKPCMPRNILIVWAVKNSDELPLLHSLDMNSLCPYFYNILNLEIQTYVTRESEPPLEEGNIPKYVSSSVFPAPTQGGMSSLVGTGNILWAGSYMVLSTIGLVVLYALLIIFYINPYNVTTWWYKGILFIVCMAASIVIFGGFVIGLWHLWDLKTAKNMDDENRISGLKHDEPNAVKNPSQDDFVNIITYGQRPNFKEIFGSMAERWGNVDIGVMVCGPTALQTSIAKECRSKNFGRIGNEPIFHFNSHSFDL